MRHTLYRIFYDYEKEEEWINSLADKGFVLVDYFWIRYVFEDTLPGKYCYHIEFLEHRATHPLSAAYLRFLEDLGIEHIASYMHWVYLRKEKDGTPFQLYTDLDSQIDKMRRIRRWWFTIAGIEYGYAVYELALGIYMNVSGANTTFIWVPLFVVLLILGTFLLNRGLPIHKKIKKLLKEKTIYEE